MVVFIGVTTIMNTHVCDKYPIMNETNMFVYILKFPITVVKLSRCLSAEQSRRHEMLRSLFTDFSRR